MNLVNSAVSSIIFLARFAVVVCLVSKLSCTTIAADPPQGSSQIGIRFVHPFFFRSSVYRVISGPNDNPVLNRNVSESMKAVRASADRISKLVVASLTDRGYRVDIASETDRGADAVDAALFNGTFSKGMAHSLAKASNARIVVFFRMGEKTKFTTQTADDFQISGWKDIPMSVIRHGLGVGDNATNDVTDTIIPVSISVWDDQAKKFLASFRWAGTGIRSLRDPYENYDLIIANSLIDALVGKHATLPK